MGDGRAAVPDRRPFALGHMDGVTENRARPGEAEFLADAELVRRLGEKFRHPSDFLGIFRQVRLHQGVRVFLP